VITVTKKSHYILSLFLDIWWWWRDEWWRQIYTYAHTCTYTHSYILIRSYIYLHKQVYEHRYDERCSVRQWAKKDLLIQPRSRLHFYEQNDTLRGFFFLSNRLFSSFFSRASIDQIQKIFAITKSFLIEPPCRIDF